MFEDLLPELVKSISAIAGAIPVVFKGMERQYAKGNTPESANRHDFHELIYVRSGKANMIIEERMISLRKGDNIIIRPGVLHTVKVDSGVVDLIILYFGLETEKTYKRLIAENHELTGLSEVNFTTLESFLHFASGETSYKGSPEEERTPYLSINSKRRQDLSVIVERIIDESRDNGYAKDLMMQFLAMELIITLARALRDEWEESLRVKAGKSKELIMIAQEFIRNNHERDISISDVASHVFLSQGYFTRAFKETAGISPISFLIQVRIEHACRLLENENIKVAGIAKAVGFASPQRFNAAFKKHIGLAPLEYRKKMSRT